MALYQDQLLNLQQQLQEYSRVVMQQQQLIIQIMAMYMNGDLL